MNTLIDRSDTFGNDQGSTANRNDNRPKSTKVSRIDKYGIVNYSPRGVRDMTMSLCLIYRLIS